MIEGWVVIKIIRRWDGNEEGFSSTSFSLVGVKSQQNRLKPRKRRGAKHSRRSGGEGVDAGEIEASNERHQGHHHKAEV